MDWRDTIRNLWVERMIWTRHYIISLMMGLRDLSFVFSRAFRNVSELSYLLSQFYGPKADTLAENLQTQHLLILSELASIAKSHQDITPAILSWDENKNAFIDLVMRLNPNVDREAWQKVIDDQFAIELNLLLSLQTNEYEQGIANFDLAHDNAQRIARLMISTIENQFQQQ